MATLNDNPLLFAGSSHPSLAQEVANELGVELGKVSLTRFPDREVAVQIKEDVCGRDVFVFQSVAIDPNFYLVELLIMLDALKRSSAKSIIAVIPYFGYCRQDRKDKPRVPITAKLVANLLVEAGVTRVIVVDLHAGQLEGFFDVPVDHIHGRAPLIEKLNELNLTDFVVIAPDIGSVKIARSYADQLNAEMAVVVNSHRLMNDLEVTLIGDVNGKNVLLADDMCSGGRTLASAAQACHGKGAKRILAAVTHGVCVGRFVSNIEQSPLESVLITNTIPYTDRLTGSTKLISVSIASQLAHAIRCIVTG